MPLRITAGLSRKHGLPDYGSVGASCQVEFQIDPETSADSAAFQQQVQQAFQECRTAVDAELSKHGVTDEPRQATTTDQAPATTSGRTQANGNGNGPKPISDKQLGYARQLAGQISQLGIGKLDGLAQQCFNKPVAALTSFQGSQLIDQLLAIKDGSVELPADLAGARR